MLHTAAAPVSQPFIKCTLAMHSNVKLRYFAVKHPTHAILFINSCWTHWARKVAHVRSSEAYYF